MINPYSPVRSLHNSTRLLVALGSFGLAITAQANVWSFGGTRVAGMGGAGLALPFDVVDNNRLNPGMLGYGPRRVALEQPGVDLDLGGIDYNKVRDDFSNFNGGVTSDTNKLLNLGTILGTQQRDVALDISAGIYAYGFAFNGLAQATVETRPNGPLEAFSANPTAQELSSEDGAQLNAYGLGYYSYGFSYGHKLPMKDSNSTLSVGGSINIYRAYYSHQQGTYTGYSNGAFTGSFQADANDMGSSTNDISKSGAGFDLGLLGNNSDTKSPFYYGLVIHNLVEPNIKFQEEQFPTGGAVGVSTMKTLEPFKRRVDLGVGTNVNNKLLAALDWDDAGNATGAGQVGLGGEYKVYGNSSVRAGYNTLSGFSIGASIFGLNIAVSAHRSLVVGTNIRF